MPTGTDYDIAIVIVNRHEPEGETAGRLIELAEEKGFDARVVEAQRGEHDAALSFRVPQEVADDFNAERAERWPDSKIENDGDDDVAGVDGDAYAADATRSAKAARTENAKNQTNQGRTARTDKAKE
jgi:hypothetical protein